MGRASRRDFPTRRWYDKSYISGRTWPRIAARGNPRKAYAARNERAAVRLFPGDGTTGKEDVGDSGWYVQIWKNLCRLPELPPSPNLKSQKATSFRTRIRRREPTRPNWKKETSQCKGNQLSKLQARTRVAYHRAVRRLVNQFAQLALRIS